MASAVAPASDHELFSASVKIESKIFYLDLKQGAGTTYLKLSERSAQGRATLVVPADWVPYFTSVVTNYVASADEGNGSAVEGGGLAPRDLQLDSGKTFHFEVGSNARGEFLSIAEAGAATPRGRAKVIVPRGGAGRDGWRALASELARVNNKLQEVTPQAGGAHQQGQFQQALQAPQQPTVRQVRVQGQTQGQDGGDRNSMLVVADRKKFFFDMAANDRGSYLKISEVHGPQRSSIIVPSSALPEFAEAVQAMLAKTHDEQDASLWEGQQAEQQMQQQTQQLGAHQQQAQQQHQMFFGGQQYASQQHGSQHM